MSYVTYKTVPVDRNQFGRVANFALKLLNDFLFSNIFPIFCHIMVGPRCIAV